MYSTALRARFEIRLVKMPLLQATVSAGWHRRSVELDP
jgi:hypothetical protein